MRYPVKVIDGVLIGVDEDDIPVTGHFSVPNNVERLNSESFSSYLTLRSLSLNYG